MENLKNCARIDKKILTYYVKLVPVQLAQIERGMERGRKERRVPIFSLVSTHSYIAVIKSEDWEGLGRR